MQTRSSSLLVYLQKSIAISGLWSWQNKFCCQRLWNNNELAPLTGVPNPSDGSIVFAPWTHASFLLGLVFREQIFFRSLSI